MKEFFDKTRDISTALKSLSILEKLPKRPRVTGLIFDINAWIDDDLHSNESLVQSLKSVNEELAYATAYIKLLEKKIHEDLGIHPISIRSELLK